MAKDNNTSMTVNVNNVVITFNQNAVNEIEHEQAVLTLTMAENIENSELVLNISLNNKTFGSGKATISVPYNKVVPENKTLKVYYIDNDGNKTDMNAVVVDGMVTFETSHFSKYALMLEDVNNQQNTDGNEEKDNNNKNGAGTIILIIVCVIVVIIIAFLVFWLVIKKKSFADLLNIFKKNK